MIVELLYLLAGVLFILGVKQLSRVKTASRGNCFAALGMLVAVIATLVQMELNGVGIGWMYIGIGIGVGTVLGIILALSIKMTAMPELVALFNGFGGGASVLVALSYVFSQPVVSSSYLTVLLSILIGSVTFTGSILALLKLRGYFSKAVVFPGRILLLILLFVAVLVVGFLLVMNPSSFELLVGFIVLSLILGFFVVLGIGGADMPVVIALLNSYSGIAAGMAGFVLGNTLLVIGGALVGASGLILTQIMCKAMNRSLVNVMFGGFGAEATTQEHGEYHDVKQASAEEAALLLDSAKKVVIVPGYGLAVAQAQYAIEELADILEKKGVEVAFGIHPVAGRMPGHMNVLLAEAHIDYGKLFDLEINKQMKQTDVVLVVGANDVVNPAAASDKSSPLYGMPILNVHEAGSVLVLKRSLSPGFAGVKNELFEAQNARMIFQDAKEGLQKIVGELEEL